MLHEALVELFRRRITLAPEVLSEALGVALPEFTEARGETVDFTQIIPTEYRADLVVLLLDGRPVLAIVVEVQLSRDLDKRRSWPVYVTTLRARFDCPACLLVVCSDAETARWCASPIEIGHEGFALRPYVLGPGSVPVVTEASEPRQRRSWPSFRRWLTETGSGVWRWRWPRWRRRPVSTRGGPCSTLIWC